MDTDAVKQIQDRLAELPADVRAAIQDAELDKKVREVGAKNNLHIDQIGELGDEVMLAMLGFSPLESFGARLAQVLAMDPAAADKLAADIGTEIFAPIRESMKKWAAERAAPAPKVDAQPAAVLQSSQGPTLTQGSPRSDLNPSAKPPVPPDMHKADVILSQPTVSPIAAPLPASAAQPAPQSPLYKSDPYREPV